MLANAGPLSFSRGPRAALLLHGLAGSPRELLPLGEHLAARGISVVAPVLAGHGTSAGDLARVAWPQWPESVREPLRRLREEHRPVTVVGFSLGALTAMALAADPETAPLIDSLVLLSCPVRVLDRRVHYAHLLKAVMPYVPTRMPSDPAVVAEIAWYDRTPVAAVAQVWRLTRHIIRVAGHIKQPALIIQGDADRVVSPGSAAFLASRLGSQRKELHWVPGCGHLTPLTSDRQTLFDRVATFVSETELRG